MDTAFFLWPPPPGISCAPGSRGGYRPPIALSSSSVIYGRWASTFENSIYLYWPEENTYRASLYLVTWACVFWGQPACISAGATVEIQTLPDKGKTASPVWYGRRSFLSCYPHQRSASFILHPVQPRRAGLRPAVLPFTLFSYGCFVYAYLTMQRVKWDAEDRSTWLLLLCFEPPVAANTWGMFVLNPALDFTPRRLLHHGHRGLL